MNEKLKTFGEIFMKILAKTSTTSWEALRKVPLQYFIQLVDVLSYFDVNISAYYL